jgi:hypothetical protein
LEDELSLRNLKARKFQNVQQHYRRQDFLYYGLTVDSHKSIRTDVDAQDGFVLLRQNLNLSLWDPHDANVIGTRIILAFKNYGTIDEAWKAHFIIQGCLDDEVAEIVSDSATVANFSVRICSGWQYFTSLYG